MDQYLNYKEWGKCSKTRNCKKCFSLLCNLIENAYLQDSKLLFSFFPNSRFGSLLSITPQVLKYCDTADSIFYFIEISFIEQNGRPLQIDDDITVSIIIKNQYA